MIQQRSLSLLSSAERQLLRQQWRQNNQCLRSFHTSKTHLAEEPTGNDNGTPYNAPKRGPNRQERAAKVSSEVSALAADLPKANLNGRNAEVEGAHPRSPGVSPQSQGKDVSGGRMGENDSPRKEGPFAQGVGRVVRESAEDPTTSKQAQGIRTPNSKMETPSEGGASVMEPIAGESQAAVSNAPNASTAQAATATFTPMAQAKPTAPKNPIQDPETYFSSGSGTSTLLSANIPGLIQDRANLLSPRSSTSAPTNAEIQHRLILAGNKLTAFRSQKEKEAYSVPQQVLHERLLELRREARAEVKKGVAKEDLPRELVRSMEEVRAQLKKHPKFRPVPQSAQQDIINRMVLGKYDEQGLLSGKQVHRQPVMDSVARELLRNSTYLAKDSEKLLAKLKGLLPAAAAAPAATKAKGPEAKAKA